MGWGQELKKILLPKPASEANETGDLLSAVLAAIGWDAQKGENQIVLMKRTMTVGFHKGQMSFPGGIQELGDASPLETALRESEEEIGLKPSDVEVFGALSPVRARNTVLIYPWVGKISLPYPFRLNAAEVDQLLLLPLARLLDEGLKPVQVAVESFSVKSEGIVVDGELVWGATARMLKELRQTLLRLQTSGPI